jgi:bifunctional polynucleotide phosphatase/kinase
MANAQQQTTTNVDYHCESSLYYHVPKTIQQGPVASFDVDWTVTYAQENLFGTKPNDIHLLPNRRDRIQQLYNGGYNIALFTNQKAVSVSAREKTAERISNAVRKLGVDCFIFIAFKSSSSSCDVEKYRKPQRGMWDKLEELLPGHPVEFFVGDALGRPQDFSDSDRLFAEAGGVIVITPEDFFGVTGYDVVFPNEKVLIVCVGAPGTGKSTYFKSNLEPLGYIQISQDLLKTKAKVDKTFKKAVEDGVNIVIDSTNPTLDRRKFFYDIASENGYTVIVLYFVRDGHGWNKLREKGNGRVPDIVYHTFFKNLEPPTEENTPGIIHHIS